MKKIILLLFILLPTSVLAEDIFEVSEMPYAICDENGYMSKVNFLRYNYSSAYFFNENNNYNYHFEDYYEDNDDYYMELAEKYLWILPLVNYKVFYNYHAQFITRYLWEKMYPDKVFSFCNEDDNTLNRKEIEYQETIQRVEKVINGIDLFQDNHIQKPYEEVVYQDYYLPLFKIKDNDNLNAKLKNGKLTISGEPGEYTLIFQLNQNGAQGGKIFYDGVNRIANLQKIPLTEYQMHLKIEPYYLNIRLDNDNNHETCFKLENEDGLKEMCTMNNELSFEVKKSIYHLSLNDNDYYEDYDMDLNIEEDTTINLSLTLKVNEVENNEEDNSYLNEVETEEDNVYLNEAEIEEENISFVAKNTYINI